MTAQRLTVVLNGESQLEFDRGKELPEAHHAALERMDARMDQGILLDSRPIERPDALQRARFVAGQLLQAVQDGNETMAAATCTWLAVRIPDLQQVRGVLREDGLAVDLVFDRGYAPEVKLNFIRPERLSS
jgi:hypothetical protein